MPRSTHTERAQHLNAAFDLLAQGYRLNEAAETLAAQFGFSLRQAYRYLQEAQEIKRPVAVPEPITPITIKIPADVAVKLRAHAQARGLTLGDIVARAVTAFLNKARWHG